MTFHVAAGEDWDSFVARTVDEECAGIECLSGIPGSVGGTPVQNVGAYGQEVSETIREVEATSIGYRWSRGRFTNADCGFAYRTSMFNTTERDRYIILRVSFALRRGRQTDDPLRRPAEGIWRRFGGARRYRQVRNAVREIRRSKAMLIVPGDDDCSQRRLVLQEPGCSAKQVRRAQRWR